MAAEINGYEPGTVAHLYLTRLAVIIVVYRCSIFLCHLDLEMIDIEIQISLSDHLVGRLTIIIFTLVVVKPTSPFSAMVE